MQHSCIHLLILASIYWFIFEVSCFLKFLGDPGDHSSNLMSWGLEQWDAIIPYHVSRLSLARSHHSLKSPNLKCSRIFPVLRFFSRSLWENQGKAGFTFYFPLKAEEKTPEEVGLEDAVCISSNPMALRSGLTVGSVRCRGLNWGGGIGGIFPFLEVFQTFSWNSWRKWWSHHREGRSGRFTVDALQISSSVGKNLAVYHGNQERKKRLVPNLLLFTCVPCVTLNLRVQSTFLWVTWDSKFH